MIKIKDHGHQRSKIILHQRSKIKDQLLRYELSAVMVHEGDNADCGHYWDIIRHPHSGVWFKYNDKVRRRFTGFDADAIFEFWAPIVRLEPGVYLI